MFTSIFFVNHTFLYSITRIFRRISVGRLMQKILRLEAEMKELEALYPLLDDCDLIWIAFYVDYMTCTTWHASREFQESVVKYLAPRIHALKSTAEKIAFIERYDHEAVWAEVLKTDSLSAQDVTLLKAKMAQLWAN